MPAICLLAPVPLEHLEGGLKVCQSKGKIAFGSRAFEVFRELDAHRDTKPVTVFIYASGNLTDERLETSWTGNYVRWLEVSNGAHPDGMTYRPPSTANYPSDNKGHWAGFWEVKDLRKLGPEERIPTGQFVSFKSGKQYKNNFIPEGPLLVAYQV
jgi:hypothetical protein